MDSVFTREKFHLSNTLASNYNYAVQQVNNKFADRILYNDQLVAQIADIDGGNTITNYDPYAQ